MKKLKLEHNIAQLVAGGQMTSTWRLYDDKDLSVNDEVLIIDKVVAADPNTWRIVGVATVDKVTERRLEDVSDRDIADHGYVSRQDMLDSFRRYYGPNVNWQTPLKVIDFHFTPHVFDSKKPDVLPQSDKVIIYADGGSRGNPGPSAAGYVIYDDQHVMLVNRGIYLGITTNNQAEYTALKLALEEARSVGAHSVHVYMDSLLVVNQMRGIFKVKNRDLWPIHDAVKQLCTGFKQVDFTQVPRESNRLADDAVNAALDDHLAAQPAGHET